MRANARTVRVHRFPWRRSVWVLVVWKASRRRTRNGRRRRAPPSCPFRTSPSSSSKPPLVLRKVSVQARAVLCCTQFLSSDGSLYVSALYERMRADQKKFGKSSWAAAVERMERLQYAVSKETLQLMRAKEICLEQKKHALKEEVK